MATERSDLLNERMATFGARLKAARKRRRLTQAELADRSGLTPSAISELENVRREPCLLSIVRLADALETTPNHLIGYQEVGDVDPMLRSFIAHLQTADPRYVDFMYTLWLHMDALRPLDPTRPPPPK